MHGKLTRYTGDENEALDHMTQFTMYWGPTILIAVILIVTVRFVLMRQAQFFKGRADNDKAQTEELQKIAQTLQRIAESLEARH